MSAELKSDNKHPESATVLADLEKHLESTKWNLWHGNFLHALQRIDDLDDDLEILKENPANKKKLLKAVKEFRSYIEANQAFIPNYGDRRFDRELCSQQALREEAANALDPAWRTSAIANPCAGSERRLQENLQPMVPRNEI